MKSLSKFLFILFLSIIILSFIPLSHSVTGATTTKILVFEGNIICFELPKELAEAEKRKETTIGVFITMINEEICLVDIDGKETRCYNPQVPQEYGQQIQIQNKLFPGVNVYLVKNIRRIKQTEWDIVSVGVSVGPLQAYSSGIVTEAKVSESLKLIAELAKEGAPEKAPEVAPTPSLPTTIIISPPIIQPPPPEEEEEEEGESFPDVTTAPSTTTTTEPTPTPTPEAPTITTSGTLTSGTEGISYSQTISATGGSAPYTWSLVSGSFPSGLTLSSSGIISGLPQAGTAGSYTFTIQVTDSASQTNSKQFSLTINSTDLTITTSSPLPNGTEGISYSQTLSATGGSTPYTWSLVSGSLPSGLTLSSSGIISGLPQAGTAGSYTFTITVTDSASQSSSKQFSLTIGASDLTISTSTLTNGIENTAYSTTISASGGTTPYTWTITIGSLPAGLSLSTEGVISGTPTTRGTNTFTVKVTDTNSITATKELSLKIGYYLTALDDYVWVANWMDDNVTRITKSNLSTTNIGVGDGPRGVAVDDTCVWVVNLLNANVTRITKSDSSTTNITVGVFPSGVAVDNTYVWVANGFNDNVTRITKSTLSKTNINVGDNPHGVAVDNTYVWVTNADSDNVTRITKSDLSTTNIAVGGYPEGVIADDTYVWVANWDDDNVTRITKSDLSTTNIATGPAPGGIAVDDTYVWVPDYINNKAIRITKSDLSKTNINVGTQPFGVAVDNTYVWMTNDASDNVTRITKSDSSTTNIAVGDRPLSRGDATGYNFDQFFTGTLVDPNITGRVYDSVTGETIPSPIISIYPKDSTTALASTTNNPYSFSVSDGYYYLRVEKEGYTFPSNTKNGVVPGDHGEVFYASGSSMGIDIPIDQGYPLEITKTANKRRVVNGDIITFDVKIRNNSMWAFYNINIIDEITNGFKYVSKSTYVDSSQLPETNVGINNRRITFKLTNVPGYAITHLTYQVRVGTGISPGEYKTTAVAWDRLRDWRMSNETSCKVEVVYDALFTLGTIIGKVFSDTNGDGVQQRGEKGIGGVKIATEYGIIVETDRDGKYHIPAVPPGNHLLKVDPATLPECTKFSTENPYFVKITEGLLAKANFGVSPLASLPVNHLKEKQANGPTGKLANQFFIVALGEGVVRGMNTSGNIEMVEQDDRYDEGVNLDGKLALYLKGKIKGKYLITLSVDTDRRPTRRGKAYEMHKLFTNLDPDKYYPVYGDASKISYEAADTQDELYLLIEWDESHIKWGSFNTDIPLYNRTMQGANIVYQSVKKTRFGDPYTKINTFYARAYQIAAHDEFIGTGGSLYYLRHTPVIEGSEKVRVELRDEVSKETIAIAILTEEKDYEIDYDTGRIILKKPLSSVNYSYSAGIISNDILQGSRAYLIVDYEYESNSSIRRQAYGIKAGQWLGNHIKVGGTYIEEEKTDRYYRLMGGDGTIKLNKDTEIVAEYNRSEETQLSGAYSIDGGLSYSVLSNTANDNKTGSSFSIKGKTKLFSNTDINAGYTRQDANYSATSTISTVGSSIYTGSILTRFTKNLMMGIRHITQEAKDATLATDLIGNNKVHTTTGLIDYLPGKWDMRLEYQHQNTENPFIDYTYAGYRQLMDHDIIGGRVGYKLTERFHPYIGGQASIQGQVNNQGYAGLEYQVWDNTYLRVKETVGNLGNSTLLGLTSQITPETEAYTNIEIGNNAQLGKDGKFTRTTVGQKTRIDKNSTINWQKDYSSWQGNILQGNLIGYETKLSDTLSLGANYERSQIEKEPTSISRDTGSITLSYLNVDWLKTFSKVELREDRGNDIKRQWLTQNNLLWQLTQDISILGRGNWSETYNRSQHSTDTQFHELGVGFAYRPVEFDRLNLLAKYSYITNDMPESQNDFTETQEDIRNIYAIEGAYDICRYLQLVGKFAMRDMSEKVGPRDWTDSETYLYIGRLNFHMTSKWDIATEYRTLANRQIEDSKSGWLLEIDREIAKYIRLGAGYNFTDYDDDLSNSDNYDASGWFVRINGKY